MSRKPPTSHRRESVWINPAIRTSPAHDAISPSAFGYWIDLPFLVVVDPDGNHLLPELPKGNDFRDAQIVPHLISELEAAGLIEPLSGGVYRMTPLARQYYSLTEPEDEAR